MGKDTGFMEFARDIAFEMFTIGFNCHFYPLLFS